MLDVIEPKKLTVHTDERGWLFEILRAEEVKGDFGQMMVTVAKEGVAKGNHYHKRKTEWYCVLKGEMKLVLKDKRGAIKEVMMSSEEVSTLKIPPGVSHGFKNVGKGDCVVLIYIDEVFDSEDPDTFPDKVIS